MNQYHQLLMSLSIHSHGRCQAYIYRQSSLSNMFGTAELSQSYSRNLPFRSHVSPSDYVTSHLKAQSYGDVGSLACEARQRNNSRAGGTSSSMTRRRAEGGLQVAKAMGADTKKSTAQGSYSSVRAGSLAGAQMVEVVTPPLKAPGKNKKLKLLTRTVACSVPGLVRAKTNKTLRCRYGSSKNRKKNKVRRKQNKTKPNQKNQEKTKGVLEKLPIMGSFLLALCQSEGPSERHSV